MLFLIIKREIVHNVLSFRFIVTHVLLFCLVLLSVYLMTNDYQARFQTYTTELNTARDKLATIDDIEDPSEQFQEFQRTSLIGVRPPKNLSILAKGLDGLLPTQSETRDWMSGGQDRLSKNLLFEVFQTPDFVYVVHLVLSLLALLFVFDSVCGEKERGSLKLLLSNAVPRDTVLIGKWIGGYVSIAVPFSIAALAGFSYVYMNGSLELGGDGPTRFVAIVLISLLYISGFFTLGLMISVLTHRSATALLFSLMVWICWILVVPNLAPVVARLVAPVPSRQVIDAEIEAINTRRWLMEESLRNRGNMDPKKRDELNQESDRRRSMLEDFYQDKLSFQTSVSQNLARLSPSASYVFAATRLAGTGATLSDDFAQAEQRFKESVEKYMNHMYREGVDWGPEGPTVKDPEWFNLEDIPRFKMLEERLEDSLDAAMTDILLLAIYNVVFLMASYLFFLRYDVT